MLGSLEVFDGAEWVTVGAAKARSLLAVLLVRASRVVSMDELVDGLWGEHPPRTAASQVHGYVMRLRRVLGDREGRLLRTVAPGYQLAVGAEDVDALLFDVQVDQGNAALRAGQPDRAAEVLGQALALWRGPALADVTPVPLVASEVSRLVEQQLAAQEAWVDANLAGGRHAMVISELKRLVADHPLRERLWGQLMVALHRNGRQAEALESFKQVRRVLIDEVGTEPCADLQRLHQQLLSGDVGNSDNGGQQFVPVTAQVAPVCQLPADVGDFTGRQKQLDHIRTLLAGRSVDGPPPVVVVCGGPGVGKSTLAVHAVHRVAAEFDDGQLYLDLAGTAEHPRDPEVMLGELLHALGVTGAGIPDGTPARATLFRSLLARRRVLIVLDDAADSEQVRPLLPATGGCAVVVTSRRLLTDLVGAWHVEVDVFAEQEAHRLLSGVIGSERMAGEPEEAAAIVRACAYLPLALRIAAGKLLGRPTWPLRVLRERLEDQSRRLSELRLGELGVRASFEASVDLLPADAVLALRLLGLLGPVTVPGWVLGPLLDRPDADDVLDVLVDANLLRLVEAGVDGQPRYRLHDLLRTYAVEGARAIAEPERRDAVTRLLAAWLDLLANAVDRLPRSLFQPPRGTTPRRPLPNAVVDRMIASPQSWFEAERHALIDAVRLAVDWRMDEAAWELAATVAPYYDQRNHYEDWRHTHTLALDACRRAGNRRGEAFLLRGLAQINIYRDEYDTATARLRRCLQLFQRVGDKRGEGLATASLGTLHRVQGRPERALEYVWQALHIVTATGDRTVQAQLTNGLGMIQMALGRLDEARTSFQEALAISQELGDEHREAVVLSEASQLYDLLGETDRAFDALDRARQIFDDIDDERCLAYAQLRAGRIHAAHNDTTSATTTLHHAAEIFAKNGNRMEEAQCRQRLGELSAQHHDLPTARHHLQRALHLWHSIGDTVHATETEAALSRLGTPDR